MAIERCERCGANLAMVGRVHRCIPRPDAGSPVEENPRPHAKRSQQGAATPGRVARSVVGNVAKPQEQPERPPPVPPASDRPFRKPLAKDADKTLMATKPWEAEGVSRRTWYRLRKKGQLK